MESRTRTYVVTLLALIILIVLPFVYAQSVSASFSRGVDCTQCSVNKVAELTPANLTITATPSELIENTTIQDVFPNTWSLVEANGGTVTALDANTNAIQWALGNVSAAGVSRWYILQSPAKTAPPTDYYFTVSLFDANNSWNDSAHRIKVADPTEVRDQAQYVWLDASDIALAAENTAYASATTGTGYHLRVGIGVTSANWRNSQVSLWLGDSSCSSFTTEITSSSTPAAYWDDLDHADQTTLSSSVLSSTAISEHYVENEPSAIMSQVRKNQQGEWDFTITFDSAGTYYLCMREHGTPDLTLDSYTAIPAITVTAANNAPTITSTDDDSTTAAPTNAGAAVLFTTSWTDAGDQVKLHVCKTAAITAQACDAGSWCDSAAFTGTSPESCTYATSDPDAESNNWFAYVCDDEDSCSTVESTNSPFVVNHRPYASTVSITPSSPNATDTLTCTYTFNDPDSDLENTTATAFKWYLQNEGSGPFNELVGEIISTLSPANFDGNDVLYCEARVVDEHGFQDDAYVASSTVTIQEVPYCDVSTDVGSVSFGSLAPSDTSTAQAIQVMNNGTIAGNVSISGTAWIGSGTFLVSSTEFQGGAVGSWLPLALTEQNHYVTLAPSTSYQSELRVTIPTAQAPGAYAQNIIYTVQC